MIFAVLIPPLYFLLNKRIGMFFITCAMFIAAIICAITMVFLPVSLILWFVAAYMAAHDLRRKKMKAAMTTHAELIADKMAEKFPTSSSLPRDRH